MRPVTRGPCPTDAHGKDITFEDYKDARPWLVDERIGPWCSYCEMPVHNQAAVEHLQPKSKHGALTSAWDNFLLACASCNSTKGAQDPDPADLLLPDRDNTFVAYAYRGVGSEVFVDVRSGLPSVVNDLACATRDLVGLHRQPGGTVEPTERDVRWKNRREAWGKARRARDNLTRRDTPELRATIVDLAEATGFFSIWMTVFASESALRVAFVVRFRGTARECFDAQGEACARPSGRC